jgi:peptidoglycan/xylan/chitin deacetylase (PgdA/CDA1 family)
MLRCGWLTALIVAAGVQQGAAADCGNRNAIGTARTLELDTKAYVAVSPPSNSAIVKGVLPLDRGEVVLTFDDGPTSWSTPKNLDILAEECVHATYFMIGKRAEAAADVVRRIGAAGHTLASHSWSHLNLAKLPYEQAVVEIEHGYEAVERAGYGSTRGADWPRLFRFPEYAATPPLYDFIRQHRITSVGADISPADWRGDPPDVTLGRLRRLLDQRDRGIIVLHDNQPNTTALLPALFAELKSRHMKIVHLSPK